MKNSRLLVFSVYSHDLEDYPYFPFVADSVSSAIKKFHKFLSIRPGICPGAELHVIGTCEEYFDYESGGRLENIQPLLLPQRVEIKKTLFGRTLAKLVILGSDYFLKIKDYLVHSMKG